MRSRQVILYGEEEADFSLRHSNGRRLFHDMLFMSTGSPETIHTVVRRDHWQQRVQWVVTT